MARPVPRPRVAATVLVVEDDADLRAGVCAALAAAGYDVAAASHGAAALAWLGAAPWPPAVILLDWQMPVLDGAGFLAARRGEPRLARLPVVVVTADVAPAVRPDEVVGVLAKPVSLPRLLAALDVARGPGD